MEHNNMHNQYSHNENNEFATDLMSKCLEAIANRNHGLMANIISRNNHKMIFNIKDENGNSLITMAIIGDDIKIVELLCRFGANPNIPNNKGNTSLHFAVSLKHYDIVEILLQHGADETLANHKGLNCWENNEGFGMVVVF